MGLAGKFVHGILKSFFHLLYHEFAWTYDWVADIVSIGRWREWIYLVVPYLRNSPILELGHGPGHLQVALQGNQKTIYGIDESRQMVRIAKKHILDGGFAPLLVQGNSEDLPYSSKRFRYVVATFPSEYITAPDTLCEIWRVLADGGELIVVAGAWITGERIPDRLAAWLFRVTGQAPQQDVSEIMDWITKQIKSIKEINFHVKTQLIELDTSDVLLIFATKEAVPNI